MSLCSLVSSLFLSRNDDNNSPFLLWLFGGGVVFLSYCGFFFFSWWRSCSYSGDWHARSVFTPVFSLFWQQLFLLCSCRSQSVWWMMIFLLFLFVSAAVWEVRRSQRDKDHWTREESEVSGAGAESTLVRERKKAVSFWFQLIIKLVFVCTNKSNKKKPQVFFGVVNLTASLMRTFSAAF